MFKLSKGLALTCLFAAGAALAQVWPTKPIQVILPFPPGGVDAKARIVTTRVGEILGQPLVVVNMPGAGWRLGTDKLLRSAPDGYTIGVAGQVNTWLTPVLDHSVTYDTFKDMTLLTTVYEAPMVLVAGPKGDIKTIGELLRSARAYPGKLDFAAPSGASSFRVDFERFKTIAGVDLSFVPYRGVTPAMQDVIGGQVEVGFADLATLPLIKAGRLRALAVTGDRRISLLPDVPTIKEVGIPFTATGWLGFAAPVGLPPAVQARLVEAFSEAIRDPKVRSALESDGSEVVSDPGPAGLRSRITKDLTQFRKNVRPGMIKID